MLLGFGCHAGLYFAGLTLSFHLVVRNRLESVIRGSIGADPVRVRRSGLPLKFGCGILHGSDLHENFTEINVMSAKSTPGAAV